MYKYYKFNLMNNSFKYFALSMLLVAMTGCTADDIVQTGGTLPDETPMNSIVGQLHSGSTFSNMITVGMYQDDGPATEEIIYTLTKPATTPVTIKAVPSPELVAKYNSDNSTEMKEFPAANVTFENGGSLTVPTGKKTSPNMGVTLSPEGLEAGTLYLLAITLEQDFTGVDAQATKQVIYYRIIFREKITTCIPGNDGKPIEIPPMIPGLISVFYVNTETYQPLIAAAWGVQVDYRQVVSLGNIVNLKKATIDYDANSGRALFSLGSDLSYVLEHRDKYIRHLQEHDHKVCICIENGGKGIGFCSMTNTQITDFVSQVKATIERYQLDGVNLLDDDNKYGKAGTPAMNTTSYPMLVKTLREALPDKLLTLVDKGDATEYFYDINKCGGIEVGKYIDYAWHGYISATEDLQAITPNLKGTQDYSKYTRKPIAGLNEKCYGSVNVPLYDDSDRKHRDQAAEIIAKWKSAGYKKSNIMVYGSDLIGTEYGGYETAVRTMLGDYSLLPFMDDGDSWDFNRDEVVWGEIVYSGLPLDRSLTAGPDRNPYRKDW